MPVVRHAQWVVSTPCTFYLTLICGSLRHLYNVVLSLRGENWLVDCLDKLPDEQQPHITFEELITCEEVVCNDERVQKLAADVGAYLDISCIQR